MHLAAGHPAAGSLAVLLVSNDFSLCSFSSKKRTSSTLPVPLLILQFLEAIKQLHADKKLRELGGGKDGEERTTGEKGTGAAGRKQRAWLSTARGVAWSLQNSEQERNKFLLSF